MYTEGQEVFTCSASFSGGVEIHRYIITKIANNWIHYGKSKHHLAGTATLHQCSFLSATPKEAFDIYVQRERASIERDIAICKMQSAALENKAEHFATLTLEGTPVIAYPHDYVEAA